MMHNLSSKLKVIGLFILLIIVALFPLWITEYTNFKRVNMLNMTEFTPVKNTAQPSDKIKEDIIDKLEILTNAKTKKTGIITEQRYNSLSQEYKEKIFKSIVEELTLMQSKKVIPQFDITSENVIQYITKIDFSDSTLPNKNVSVLKVLVIDSQFEYTIYMDYQTSKIYQIVFYMTKYYEIIDLKQCNFNNFLSYLGIPVQQAEYLGIAKEPQELYEIFDVNSNKPVATYSFVKAANYIGITLGPNY